MPESAHEEWLAAIIAAFDAGNLAWGRFRYETLAGAAAARLPALAEARDALGEAALAAAELQEGGSVGELRGALAAAIEALRLCRAELPPSLPAADLDEALSQFAQALALLDAPASPSSE